MQHVHLKAARWRIGAEPVGIGRELRVHGADRDSSRTMRRRRRHQVLERPEVAEPAIPVPPQAIKLHRKRPGPGAGCRVRHGEASRGRHSERRFLTTREQAVIPGLFHRRQHAPVYIALERATIFQQQAKPAGRYGQGRSLPNRRGYERQQGSNLARCNEAFRDLPLRRRRQIERGQHGPERVRLDVVPIALKILPARGDPRRFSQAATARDRSCRELDQHAGGLHQHGPIRLRDVRLVGQVDLDHEA